MEEQEHALEMERRRLSELQLGRKNMINRQLNGYGVEDLNALEGKTINLRIQVGLDWLVCSVFKFKSGFLYQLLRGFEMYAQRVLAIIIVVVVPMSPAQRQGLFNVYLKYNFSGLSQS